MNKKIDITSTALEKGIDIAKDFLDKLIVPAIEETGLLIKEKVTFWKFKNQVRTLTKAKEICEKNNINPKTISLKLLCPLLDGAALEEDPILGDKWAILLSNLVDSEQNIENHVFPYMLGQISVKEFLFLENVNHDRLNRVKKLEVELKEFQRAKPELMHEVETSIKKIKDEIAEKDEGRKFGMYHFDLERSLRELENQLLSLKHSREITISYALKAPQVIPEEELEEFELSNLIRLGLVKFVQEPFANSQTLEIPNEPERTHFLFELDIEVSTEDKHVLTELGELFVGACTEKNKKGTSMDK